MKFGRREIGEIVRCLPNKIKHNFAWISSCRYCSSRQCTQSALCRFHQNRFTFGGVTELQPNA